MKSLWLKYKQKDRAYIIPTKFGFAYGAAVLMMLAMALSYANNLVFFVSFFLASIGIVTLVSTNRNVQFLRLTLLESQSIYAGKNSEITFNLKSKFDSFEILCRILKNQKSISRINSQQTTSIKITTQNLHRGWNNIPPIYLESRYPFQLCKSWKKINIPQSILVYPERKGQASFPELQSEDGKPSKPELAMAEDFMGHRSYEKSISPRQIDWKASARHQTLLIKQFEQPQDFQKIFHWNQTQNLKSMEDRISQLALWIDQAAKKKIKFQLILPDWKSPLASGPDHERVCLSKLATWSEPHVSL